MATDKPWGGRFEKPTDELVEAFTASIDTDRHIALDDVRGSRAHAAMLAQVGLLSDADHSAIDRGLDQIRAELEADRFPWNPAHEDVHMNVEVRLRELVGEPASRLHTARSRNDQVGLDARLWARRHLGQVHGALLAVQDALLGQAEGHVDTLLPGYTHLQRGQPVRLAHHLLAYVEMFERDRERVRDAARRMDQSPLGSGALAGTPHPIDRQAVADRLGFAGVTRNSMDATGDRDFMLEAMSAAAISMVHASRLSEEVVLWSSAEFGFLRLDDGFATGSSMMPQKKNPDVAELVRAKSGRVIGDLTALLVTLKGLPLTYNRDLQEDKPPFFDAIRTWRDSLEVTARMIETSTFDRDRMARALDEGFVTATELADWLVTRQVPFREAHAVVGRIVAHCLSASKGLSELSLEELRRFHPAFDADALAWIDPEQAVERRDLPGGPARKQVAARIVEARARLADPERSAWPWASSDAEVGADH